MRVFLRCLALFVLLSSVPACRSGAILSKQPVPTDRSGTEIAAAARTQAIVRPGDETGKITIQGQQRTYFLHTPKSYRAGQPMPLVLAFHGYGSQGKDLARATGFSDLADRQGFLIAYPDGLDRRWNVLDGMGSTDDVAFASALIEHLTQTRTVEPRRIYAAGVSNGGFLVQRLACGSSQRIAAFASVAATLPQSLQPECHPSAPVSLLMINGTADQKVPWEGGQRPYGAIMSVPSSIQFWQQHNLCKTAKPTEQHPSSRVDVTRYPNCQAGSEVELVTLKGAGHVWPRGGGGANQLLNGSQEIWNFFQRHPHR